MALGLIAVMAATASAKKPMLRERDFFDDEVPLACASGKTWPVVMRCLTKTYKPTKARLEMAFDSEKLKVVSATMAGDVRELVVYTQVPDAGWRRNGLSARSNAFSEILGVERMQTPLGDSVRIDVGTSSRSSFAIAPGVIVRGVVRRRTSHVCLPNNMSCRSLVTTCEAYAHGKVYWLFHGELRWHSSLGLRMRGTGSLGGSVCTPSPSLLVGDDD